MTYQEIMDNQIFTPDQRIKKFEEAFKERREYWMQWVNKMSEYLKEMDKLTELQGEIYTRRQEALDNYHELTVILATLTKEYKKIYAEKYKTLRVEKIVPGSPTLLYGTEKALNTKIESELSDDKYLIDIIDSHISYLDGTLKTIDGIIYSINNRIRIEEIKIGR